MIRPPTVGCVEAESRPTINAIGHVTATIKQATEHTLVQGIDQLTQRLERLEQAIQKIDTATQSHRFSGQTAREPRQSQSTDQPPGAMMFSL